MVCFPWLTASLPLSAPQHGQCAYICSQTGEMHPHDAFLWLAAPLQTPTISPLPTPKPAQNDTYLVFNYSYNSQTLK